MKELRWLTSTIVRALHSEALARFGGVAGVLDEALLESALARPRNVLGYGAESSLCDLASAYGYGIIRNHAFVDGNKRTGVLAIAVFLHLNGCRFEPDQDDEIRIVEAVAAGEIDEKDLAAWITRNAEPRA